MQLFRAGKIRQNDTLHPTLFRESPNAVEAYQDGKGEID